MIKIVRKCYKCGAEIDITNAVKDILDRIDTSVLNSRIPSMTEFFFLDISLLKRTLSEKYYECWMCKQIRHNNFEAP